MAPLTPLGCILKSQCFCCFQNILRVINLPALIDAECSVVMVVLCHSQPIINVEQHKAESHALIIIMISEMRESQHPGVSPGRLSTLNILCNTARPCIPTTVWSQCHTTDHLTVSSLLINTNRMSPLDKTDPGWRQQLSVSVTVKPVLYHEAWRVSDPLVELCCHTLGWWI